MSQLLGQEGPGVVHNNYFQAIGNLEAVPNSLCGTIHFVETRMDTTHIDADWRGGGHTLFPEFELPVAVSGDWLVPLERNIILSGHGGGYSRASFPITLTDNYVGQARNALATFVFDDAGVSSVAIQITQEAAPVPELAAHPEYGDRYLEC